MLMQIFYLLTEALRALVLRQAAQAQELVFQHNSLIFNSERIVHWLLFITNAILSLSIPNLSLLMNETDLENIVKSAKHLKMPMNN